MCSRGSPAFFARGSKSVVRSSGVLASAVGAGLRPAGRPLPYPPPVRGGGEEFRNPHLSPWLGAGPVGGALVGEGAWAFYGVFARAATHFPFVAAAGGFLQADFEALHRRFLRCADGERRAADDVGDVGFD